MRFERWQKKSGSPKTILLNMCSVKTRYCLPPLPVTVDKESIHFYEGANTNLHFPLLEGGGFTQGFSRKDYSFIVSIYNRHFQGTILFNDLRLAGIRYLQMLPQPVTVITMILDTPRKLTWQGNIHHLKMYLMYLWLKMVIFQCHSLVLRCHFCSRGSRVQDLTLSSRSWEWLLGEQHKIFKQLFGCPRRVVFYALDIWEWILR